MAQLRELSEEIAHFHVVAAGDNGRGDATVAQAADKIKHAGIDGISHFLALITVKTVENVVTDLIGWVVAEYLANGRAFDGMCEIGDSSRIDLLDRVPEDGVESFAVDDHAIKVKKCSSFHVHKVKASRVDIDADARKN